LGEPGVPRITELLRRMAEGDAGAEADLLGHVYEDLRRVARGCMRGQPRGHTLQATALVHEAWLRLARARGFPWKDREHFLSVAARAMRQVLVDHARGKGRRKRGGGRRRHPLDAIVVTYEERAIDLLALDEALGRLGGVDPQAARIVERRFFGGMSVEEVARSLGVSVRTAERDWEHARAWLHRALS
jgi:RNA polymerase sigma factor (TIGR02999 family)